MAKKQHGGKRPNAGRKPIDDPKIQLAVYINSSFVEKVGGTEEARLIAAKAIEKESRKKDKK